jgi:predicted amidophosphoribosyltransferase
VPGLELTWSALPYEGVARRLVAALKFHGRTPLAHRAAEAIVDGAPAGLFGEAPAEALRPGAPGRSPDQPPGKPPIAVQRQRFAGPPGWAAVIVPVPASRSRLRARGIDPAEEIATALASLIASPLARCLVREDGPTQVGRARGERLRDPPRVHARAVPPPRVLLVDDVLTTGATLAACATALRAAGASRVTAVTFARTIARRAAPPARASSHASSHGRSPRPARPVGMPPGG